MDDKDSTWCYFANHIFLPHKLPQKDDLDIIKEHDLCCLVYDSAVSYKNSLPIDQQLRWESITRMLENLCTSQMSPTLSEDSIRQAMAKMRSGGMPLLHLVFF